MTRSTHGTLFMILVSILGLVGCRAEIYDDPDYEAVDYDREAIEVEYDEPDVEVREFDDDVELDDGDWEDEYDDDFDD